MSLSDWLKQNLTNSWMTAGDFKGNAAHCLGGYATMMTVGFLTKSQTLRLALYVTFILYTLIKEFWYDPRYEVPPQPFAGSLNDFKWYHVGSLVAVLVFEFL